MSGENHRKDEKNKGHRRQNQQEHSSTGFKKSTRDWNVVDTTYIEDLPLISRSHQADHQRSLKDLDLQRQLWTRITEKTAEAKTEKDWEHIVDLLRKLREGIVASRWSQGDIGFAVKVFEHSVDCSLKARNHGELMKSIRRLVDDLYTLQKPSGFYSAIDTILLACHNQESPAKITSRAFNLPPCEGSLFAKNVVHFLISGNAFEFLRLLDHAPHPSYVMAMDQGTRRMRILASNVLQKAYYSIPIQWATYCLGLHSNDETLVLLRDKIDTANSDHHQIRFLRISHKKSS